MAAGPRTDEPGPFGVSQLLVGLYRTGGHAVLGDRDHPRPLGERKPAPVGIAQMGRHRRGQHRGFDRRQQVLVRIDGEPADIHGEHHIGRAVLALGLEPLGETLGGVDDVDLDPGLGSEGVQEGLDEEGLPVRVEVELVRRSARHPPPSPGRRDRRGPRARPARKRAPVTALRPRRAPASHAPRGPCARQEQRPQSHASTCLPAEFACKRERFSCAS